MKKLLATFALTLIITFWAWLNFVESYDLTSQDIWLVNLFETKSKEYKNQKWALAYEKLIDLIYILKDSPKNTERTIAILEELLERLTLLDTIENYQNDDEILFNIDAFEDKYINSNSTEYKILESTNQERSKLGKQNLIFNTKLNYAAQKHAQWMMDNNTLSHEWENWSLAHQRIEAEWYQWMTVGENVAMWATSANHVIELRMDSPGHKTNILNEDFTEIGVAQAGNYWIQVFASPK